MNWDIFLKRRQPAASLTIALLAGLGGALGIGVLGALTSLTTLALIMAPFGASCVLLFSVAASPLSQPANVIGGHLVSAIVGMLMMWLLPETWWAVALAVGLAIAAMALLRVTHPPAGANPLVIFAATPGPLFVLFPVLIGAIVLVAVATAFHRATGTTYPLDS
jgi:CBS-domain-containing membrane protein